MEKPVITIGKSRLFLLPTNLFRGLSGRLHRVLITDSRYWGYYGDRKGKVLEEWASEALRRAFPSALILRNLKYDSQGKSGEADIVVNYAGYLLFVECTTKWIQPESRRGEIDAIRYDLAKSVTKCYDQARKARSAYLAGDLRLPISPAPAKIITVVITDTLYPNLLLEITKEPSATFPTHGGFLKDLVKDDDFPYIVSVFDIEALTQMVDEHRLMQFFAERPEISKLGNIIAYDEPDYLRFYLKPDYQLYKMALARSHSVLNYVGSAELPAGKSKLFLGVLEAIGSETFGIVDMKGVAGREARMMALETLYSIYCNWDEANDHLVNDMTSFKKLVDEHKAAGNPCRAIAWEGFWEFVMDPKERQARINTITEQAEASGLRALLALSYDLGPETLLELEQEEGEEEVKRFLQRKKLFEGTSTSH